jgi:hypothetical protein
MIDYPNANANAARPALDAPTYGVGNNAPIGTRAVSNRN